MIFRLRKTTRILTFCLAILSLVLGFTAYSHAQMPGLPTNLPSQSSFEAVHAGNLDIGTVRLDGETLFQVAAPTPESSASSNSMTPIERRVSSIEFHLNDIVKVGFNPDTLEIKPAILNNLVVLVAMDSDWGPKQIITVTSFDVELDEPDTIDGVAKKWSVQIKNALRRARLQRSTDYQLRQLPLILGILAIVLLVDRLVRWLQLKRKSDREKLDKLPLTSHQEEQHKIDAPDSAHILSLLPHSSARFAPQLSYERRLAINLIFGKVLFAFRFSIIFLGIALILSRFPQSRALGYWLMRVPLAYLAIPFGMWLLKSLLDAIVRMFLFRLVDQIREKRTGPEDSLRLHARACTAWRVMQEVTTYSVIVFGFSLLFYILGDLYIALALLAGIAFLSQDFLKDFLKTTFILAEDQYALGDWIQVGSHNGVVEKISLRNTQIRSASGDLYALANGTINEVTNFTHGQSGLNLLIDVSYNTDLNQAIIVMNHVAREIEQDPRWCNQIIEVRMKGVENFGDNSITIRLVLMTAVGQQWDVGREYRRRLKPAFDAAGITIPFPQRSIWFENALPTEAPQPDHG